MSRFCFPFYSVPTNKQNDYLVRIHTQSVKERRNVEPGIRTFHSNDHTIRNIRITFCQLCCLYSYIFLFSLIHSFGTMKKKLICFCYSVLPISVFVIKFTAGTRRYRQNAQEDHEINIWRVTITARNCFIAHGEELLHHSMQFPAAQRLAETMSCSHRSFLPSRAIRINIKLFEAV